MGRPVGVEPGLGARPSRLAPRWVPHFSVTYCTDYSARAMVRESFVPINPNALPWWRLWRVIVFDGRVDSEEVSYERIALAQPRQV